jgi:hypothetical protein
MEQRPPYKGNRSSISREISSIVRNIYVQNCVRKGPQLLPVLSQYKTNKEIIILYVIPFRFMKTQYSEQQSSKYFLRYFFFVELLQSLYFQSHSNQPQRASKVVSVHAIKAYRGTQRMDPLIPNPGFSRR